MASDALAGLGAFLSGAGAVMGAIWALRRTRKRMQEECDERFAALREGIKIAQDLEHRE